MVNKDENKTETGESAVQILKKARVRTVILQNYIRVDDNGKVSEQTFDHVFPNHMGRDGEIGLDDTVIFDATSDGMSEEMLKKMAEQMRGQVRAEIARIQRPPGFKLYGFLSSICSKKFTERELDALHADGLELYYEKLQAGDKAGARWVRISMCGWMLWTVVGGAVSQVFSVILGNLKPSE